MYRFPKKEDETQKVDQSILYRDGSCRRMMRRRINEMANADTCRMYLRWVKSCETRVTPKVDL